MLSRPVRLCRCPLFYLCSALIQRRPHDWQWSHVACLQLAASFSAAAASAKKMPLRVSLPLQNSSRSSHRCRRRRLPQLSPSVRSAHRLPLRSRPPRRRLLRGPSVPRRPRWPLRQGDEAYPWRSGRRPCTDAGQRTVILAMARTRRQLLPTARLRMVPVSDARPGCARGSSTGAATVVSDVCVRLSVSREVASLLSSSLAFSGGDFFAFSQRLCIVHCGGFFYITDTEPRGKERKREKRERGRRGKERKRERESRCLRAPVL